MGFNLVVDITLVLFGLLCSVKFALGDGYFVFPASALVFAIVWEALKWHGRRSVHVLMTVAGFQALAVGIRYLSHKPLVSRTTPDEGRAVLVCTAMFALALVPTLVIVATVSAS